MWLQNSCVPAAYWVPVIENKVPLGLRQNTWYKDWYYSFISWRVEKWETPTIALIKEVSEEAWVDILSENIIPIHTCFRDSWQIEQNQKVDFYFSCTIYEGEITNMEPLKCKEIKRFDIDDLPENLIEYQRVAFEHIKNWVPYSEYWFEWLNTSK